MFFTCVSTFKKLTLWWDPSGFDLERQNHHRIRQHLSRRSAAEWPRIWRPRHLVIQRWRWPSDWHWNRYAASRTCMNCTGCDDCNCAFALRSNKLMWQLMLLRGTDGAVSAAAALLLCGRLSSTLEQNILLFVMAFLRSHDLMDGSDNNYTFGRIGVQVEAAMNFMSCLCTSVRRY